MSGSFEQQSFNLFDSPSNLPPIPGVSEADALLQTKAPPIERQKLTPDHYAENLFNVARPLAIHLQGLSPIEKKSAKALMNREFGGSDSEGAWGWKDLYEAQEVALIMLLHSAARFLKTWSPQQVLTFLREKQNLCLTHTVRSEEQEQFQQFSTPLPLAFLVMRAARIGPADIVLEPSAGTGIMASMAKLNRAQVAVNELAPNRCALLQRIFTKELVFAHNAEQINDYLPPGVVPSVVIANPPFSRSPGMKKARGEAVLKHLRSALLRLSPGGRMVIITGENFKPTAPTWGKQFVELQKTARVVGSFGVDGRAYYKMGTSFATRITVFDKTPAEEPREFTNIHEPTLGSAELLELVESLPPRGEAQGAKLLFGLPQVPRPSAEGKSHLPHAPPREQPKRGRPGAGQEQPQQPPSHNEQWPPAILPAPAELPEQLPSPTITASPTAEDAPPLEEPRSEEIIEVQYQVIELPVNEGGAIDDAVFEAYSPKRIKIQGAKPHPTDLVESSAMAVVLAPIPEYQPRLPRFVVENSILSDSQLESVIYAGNSQSTYLKGFYRIGDDPDTLEPTTADDPKGRRYRRGFFLGDGTGCGKGRQVAGVIMDNFLQGREKAVWISKSETLKEDAERDWVALGGNPDDLHYLGDWKLSESVELSRGIVFVTYATLRTEKNGKSRLQQLSDWLGEDFEGAMVFDEAHEMGNAVERGGSGGRGIRAASQQGIKGLRIQNIHPGARVLYVSATGATEVSNLAYATRLGLWGTGEFSFSDRSQFIAKIESGGVAAMEIVARDLKALGLYLSRVLSFRGVENDPVRISLTPEQRAIYDKYAEGFKVIHHHMEDALKATNVIGLEGKVQNGNARRAAYSVFEGVKQRFFNHLLTSMKVPGLIECIEQDLANDHSVVIQIVSTNESLLSRRLESVPLDEYDDLHVDVTPRESVMAYLDASFPVHLYQERMTEKGVICSEPVLNEDGTPVVSQEALRIKEELLEQISLLPPLPGALEQILYHFGSEDVAEVTGRKQRILYERQQDRFYVGKRPESSNTDETQAFMSRQKRILVFSKAGGTGRSYHASLDAINQDKRVHYLLEPGWKADDAVQGLGRSHRTHQRQPPVFRVVMTDVLGELRFSSTICRRINQLGALTRGQRQAAGQDIFDDSNNLESPYAHKALHFLYERIVGDRIEGCTLAEFEDSTGLKLTDHQGYKKQEMPPMSTFLNRLLALPIGQQNLLFTAFDTLHQGLIEEAKEQGSYESGLEVLKGDTFKLLNREVLYTHPTTKSTTYCSEIEVGERVLPLGAEAALELVEEFHREQPQGGSNRLIINDKSGRAAVVFPTAAVVDRHGNVVSRVRLVRPSKEEKLSEFDFGVSQWREAALDEWRVAWQEEINKTPDYKTSRIFMVSGLLLPVWDSMEATVDQRVYRAELDNGERILGRIVPAERMAEVAKSMGLSSQVNLGPEEVYRAVMDGQKINLGGGIILRVSRVQDERRIEVDGNIASLLERLRASGCFTERINFQTRVFVSVDPFRGVEVIRNLQEAFSGGGA